MRVGRCLLTCVGLLLLGGNGDALMWLGDRGFAAYLGLVKRSVGMLWAAG